MTVETVSFGRPGEWWKPLPLADIPPLVFSEVMRDLDLVVSVDTWRSEVAREVCAAGADLLNDAWGGHDPRLVEVAGAAGVGVVCSHTGGARLAPVRNRPGWVTYPGKKSFHKTVMFTQPQ